jgi:hypothetical protein
VIYAFLMGKFHLLGAETDIVGFCTLYKGQNRFRFLEPLDIVHFFPLLRF